MKDYKLTATQDWNFYLSEIFREVKIDSILEFGLGVGTEFLLDNCNNLFSIELSIGDFNLEWYNNTVNNLNGFKNWKHQYIEVPDDIKDANDRAQKYRFPLKDVKYLDTLKKITDPYLDDKYYNIIFVDAGIHTRGDLVNLAFNKSDIIVAHDTSRDNNRILKNIYGYNIINVPSNYTEIHYEDTYMGTTLWIKNDFPELVETMKKFKVI